MGSFVTELLQQKVVETDLQMSKAKGKARKASDAKLSMHEHVLPCCENKDHCSLSSCLSRTAILQYGQLSRQTCLQWL